MFRLNVAALIQCQNQFVGCHRSDHAAWQCIQGGIELSDAHSLAALGRELKEELGLETKNWTLLHCSRFWRRYEFPEEILKKKRIENNRLLNNIGQEQLWFHIEIANINQIRLEESTGEFDRVDLFPIHKLINIYSPWKRAIFIDYCRELNLI